MTLPDFSFEQKYWDEKQLVAGADEVGRGAFAGPLMAAAVIFPPNIKPEVEINDSKKLSAKKRELAAVWIKKSALSYSFGSSEVEYINNHGIVKATHNAFRQSLQKLVTKYKNIYLLSDAFYIPYVKNLPKINQTAIIKGDTKSLSIAAASILAKVERDKLMQKLHQNYRQYDWENNKGYGTKTHREALKKHGLTSHHRITFCQSSL